MQKTLIVYADHLKYVYYILEIRADYVRAGVLGRPIFSERTCKRSESSNMIKILYYFPSWFLKRLVYIGHHFNNTNGNEIFIRTPRVVPLGHTGPLVADGGDVGAMQDIFQQGMASPFDVTEAGYTLLAVCMMSIPMAYRYVEAFN